MQERRELIAYEGGDKCTLKVKWVSLEKLTQSNLKRESDKQQQYPT